VGRPELVDVVVVDQPALGERGPADLALGLLAEVGPEPLRHGRAEALLAPPDEVGVDEPVDGRLQQVLADAVAHLVALGSAIANCTSSWSRNGTRASTEVAIVILSTAHEQQLGEAQLELQVGHLLQQIGAGRSRSASRPQPLDDVVGSGRSAPLAARRP
jgi:hypothetical protein